MGNQGSCLRPKQANDDKVTGADIIAFIEQVCFVPEGRFVGKKLELFEWQKAEICRIYDNPHGTRRAILSMGRKNAKTTLAACLLLAHLCGPPARNKPNSQLYSAAQSRDQAAIIFSLAAKMVRMNPELLQAVTIQETAKSLICPELGTRYRALAVPMPRLLMGFLPRWSSMMSLARSAARARRCTKRSKRRQVRRKTPLSASSSARRRRAMLDLLSVLIDDALGGT